MPVESFFITELREQSTNLQDQIEQLRRSIETQNEQLHTLSSRIHDDNVQLRALSSRLRDVNSQIRNNTSRRVNNSNNTNGLQMPNQKRHNCKYCGGTKANSQRFSYDLRFSLLNVATVTVMHKRRKGKTY